MGNASTYTCNHGETNENLAHAVDVHVRCTCHQDSMLAAVSERPWAKESRTCGSYAAAGCEQLARGTKRCKKKSTNPCPCDDTDTFSRDMKNSLALNNDPKILTEESVDTWQCSQKVSIDENVDALRCPLKVKSHVGSLTQESQIPLQHDFCWQKLEDAEDTDSATRVADVPHLEPPPAPCASGICISSEYEDPIADSGSDNETEQEPMLWQRPRKGAICCGGVAKCTFTPPSFAKDRETTAKLNKSLRECALFKGLKPMELDTIVDTMALETVRKGQQIVRQGEMGNALFVIVSGCVDCYLEQNSEKIEAALPNRGLPSESHQFIVSRQAGAIFGEKIEAARPNRGLPSESHQFIVSRQAGAIFGELSIIWNTPRSLSVYAHDHCVLGRLERDVYQALVVHRAIRIREQHELCLRGAKLLETLNDEQIAKLVDALELKTFKRGKAIINQGDDGQDFFIVQSGECVAKVKTGNEDEQEHRRYVKGDLFGELALINNAPRAASIIAITNVEVLRLSRRSFERMLGSLALLQQDSYKTDPRKLIADFFRPGDNRGPFGSLQQLEVGAPEPPLSSWFAVFRPTSRDAIAKMLNGNAVGKGLNVKGKSAKKNRLSGYVPFVQISSNDHKQVIENMPENSRVRIFYRNEAARQDAFERLLAAQSQMRFCKRKEKAAKTKIKNGTTFERAKGRSSVKSTKSNRSRTSITSIESKKEASKLMFDDRYIPHAYGIFVPGNVLQEVYIMQPDLSPHVDWETGRISEPAFMDMNMHALCAESSPQVVLYQHDEGDPMNPRGLLIAYAEKLVKPVVSDFDAFLVASQGMSYAELPPEQTELVCWSLDAAHNILKNSSSDSWMSRWLAFLKGESKRGFHPHTPKYGFGDPTSVHLIEDVIAQTSACGAVRHGAECFNYYFPQDLDDEYLVVWDEFVGMPWKYMKEQDLQKFLIERAHDGFSFPLNPIWPVRDPGWYDVLSALRNSKASEENLQAWYPSKAKILQRIDEIHAEFPEGFQTVACKARNSIGHPNKPEPGNLGGIGRGSCDVDLSLHQLQVGVKKSSGRLRKLTGKYWSGSKQSRSSWLPSGFFRFKSAKTNQLSFALMETE